ncbi:polysaccharide deacetylase [Neobacillus piezotolerans]|uniref:Polysaccharide deacetylase n=1 Tax=Neobacillus piezotolerans TaxID=2259171 RepID=A0A3D8GPP0_9BACI|nr:polysaccharide deacetylase family protein [Neobacillus piezotolerans]RDU36036.1 polysaccharide deacetylase [Neobacillus piezotolerans]
MALECKRIGTFIISLDFELFWGVHDVYEKKDYEENVRGAHAVVVSLLDLFSRYKIHATWAIVGMIYFENMKQLKKMIPATKPSYSQKRLSSYYYMETHPIGESDLNLFFAPHLVERIASAPFQEVATHTFSHYYCLEEGQTLEQFSCDLRTARELNRKRGWEIKSIVFPRNQVDDEYLKECKRLGMAAYRGNEESWAYRMESSERRRYAKRAFRLFDRYIPIFGQHTFRPIAGEDSSIPVNIRASRYLAKVSERLKLLEGLRLKRIKGEMTYAAKSGEAYHLWWHPHDFGGNIRDNVGFLEEILKHFEYLRRTYGFRSRNMIELADELTVGNTPGEELKDAHPMEEATV